MTSRDCDFLTSTVMSSSSSLVEATSIVAMPASPPPPKKKQKKSTAPAKKPAAKSRKKLGKLAKLVKMPIDILYEVSFALFWRDMPHDNFLQIFEQLEPADLLQVSRTSKETRHLLMRRSSIGV